MRSPYIFIRKYQGVTLVEIAIVILVAGLILAAVLKADSVIRSARIQDAIALSQDLAQAVNAFKQRYHMFPGDFPMNQVTPEISGMTNTPACWTGALKGDGNGLIDSGGNAAGSLAVPAEAQCVPEVLAQAGLVGKLDKDTDSFGVLWTVFRTRFGGRVWVKTVNGSNVFTALTAAAISIPFPATVNHVIEFENLPCSVARDLDRQIDNDNLSTGKAAASVPACADEDLVSFAVAL
jgi:hypothetical protein